MNIPAILIGIALVGFVLLVAGKVFAAFGMFLLCLEGAGIVTWYLVKITHDATNDKSDGPRF